jgi:hypothetical protein
MRLAVDLAFAGNYADVVGMWSHTERLLATSPLLAALELTEP